MIPLRTGAVFIAFLILILLYQNYHLLNTPSYLTWARVPTSAHLGPPTVLSTGRATYPRAIKLRSGDLLAVYTSYEPINAISLSSSADLGSTWSPYGTVFSITPEEHSELNNAFLYELPSGRLLCTFRHHTLQPEPSEKEKLTGILDADSYLFYSLVVYYSDDVGKTWHYLSTPASEPGPVHGNWEPFLRMSHAGELQFYYSRELTPGDQDNLMRISLDEGVSWSNARIVSGMDIEMRDGMMGVAEIKPGKGVLMTVFETCEDREDKSDRFMVWSVISRDDGNSWGERKQVYETGKFDDQGTWYKRNAGAPQIALVGKTIVVSFMTDEDKFEGRWHTNAATKIIASNDGGMTWGNKMTIAEMPAAWAGLLTLNDTSLLVLCEHEQSAEVRTVTFT